MWVKKQAVCTGLLVMKSVLQMTELVQLPFLLQNCFYFYFFFLGRNESVLTLCSYKGKCGVNCVLLVTLAPLCLVTHSDLK